jgi:hypothetical protein
MRTPTIIEKAKTFTRAMWVWAKSGFLTRRELHAERMKSCLFCDRFVENVCMECGCFLPLKTRMLTEKCPLNKWKD